ncbi:MAG: hypothetical protein LBV55_02235 [Acholeplasmatales bacterium]|nr:hypothetical protein [Acholeplasmatales bacterium]
MNFLVVNDDGFQALGILLLQKALSRFGSVYVSSPMVEQSASSQRVSIGNFINVKRIKSSYQANGVILVDGTPADCVRVGLKEWDNIDFDLILCGVNHGANLSYDTLYSGTLAAGKEAALYQISSIAFSSDVVDETTFNHLLIELTKLIEWILEQEIYKKFPLLNINIPSKNVLGYKIVPLGQRKSEPNYLKTETKFIFSGLSYSDVKSGENDYSAFRSGYITITPIKIDQNDHPQIEKLRKYLLKNKGENNGTI